MSDGTAKTRVQKILGLMDQCCITGHNISSMYMHGGGIVDAHKRRKIPVSRHDPKINMTHLRQRLVAETMTYRPSTFQLMILEPIFETGDFTLVRDV